VSADRQTYDDNRLPARAQPIPPRPLIDRLMSCSFREARLAPVTSTWPHVCRHLRFQRARKTPRRRRNHHWVPSSTTGRRGRAERRVESIPSRPRNGPLVDLLISERRRGP
jgi:hypothetical protein